MKHELEGAGKGGKDRTSDHKKYRDNLSGIDFSNRPQMTTLGEEQSSTSPSTLYCRPVAEDIDSEI